MSNVKVDWKDPSTRTDGSVLTASEIEGIEVAMRVYGAPDFTVLAVVAAGIQTFVQTDLPPGDYEFRIVVWDTQNPMRVSEPVLLPRVTVPVPVLAAPSPVVDAIVALIP